MVYQVYKIIKVPLTGNSHAICRSEDWKVLKDEAFEDYYSAVEYIIEKNIRHASPDFIDALSKKIVDRKDVLNDQWLVYQTHFIGRPPRKEIIERLKLQGVNVIN